MDAEILMSYGRVGELYDGSIWIQVAPTRGFLSKLEFEAYSFPRMMSALAGFIRTHDKVEVTLSRTEVNGSRYRLDAETIELLRTDPAAAISHMMPEPRTVVASRPPPMSDAPTGLLRAGHDTIAAAFGDHVYCAVNLEHKFECPGCGRWSIVTPKRMACPNCGLRMPGTLTGTTWFVVETEVLISAGLERYYIPRPWNPNRGWISQADLSSMFETFKTEREKCFQENVPKV